MVPLAGDEGRGEGWVEKGLVTAGGEGCVLGVSATDAADLCWDREWEGG